MRISLSSVFWKISQSLVGFALIGIQSRFMSGEELATLAIAQAIIPIIPLFDLGMGVSLTTWLVNSLPKENGRTISQDGFAIKLLLTWKLQIIGTAVFQSLLSGFAFYILIQKLTPQNKNFVMISFVLATFVHSIGVNLSKSLIATAQIPFLVKIQGLGSLLGFLGGLIALNSSHNLSISIMSLGISSFFIGMVSLLALKKPIRLDAHKFRDVVSESHFHGKLYWRPVLQISQLILFLQPLLVQYIVVMGFSDSQVVVYLMCQKIFNAIGNSLSSDTQYNFTNEQDKRFFKEDILFRFKFHYLGFTLASLLVVIGLSNLWQFILPNLDSPTNFDLLSFIPLGLLIFIDQASRIRLYILNLYIRDLYSNFAQLSFIFFTFHVVEPATPLSVNLILTVGALVKLLMVSGFSKRFIFNKG